MELVTPLTIDAHHVTRARQMSLTLACYHGFNKKLNDSNDRQDSAPNT